jgi:hypothetical protein
MSVIVFSEKISQSKLKRDLVDRICEHITPIAIVPGRGWRQFMAYGRPPTASFGPAQVGSDASVVLRARVRDLPCHLAGRQAETCHASTSNGMSLYGFRLAHARDFELGWGVIFQAEEHGRQHIYQLSPRG